jgi:hypothetical protein
MFIVDPKRAIAPTASTTPGTVMAPKTGITVTAKDATGKTVKADLAELDDASVEVWLQTIKDLNKRAQYRKKLARVRLR